MEPATRKKAVLAWLWVGLCSLSIFAVVPLARTIQRFVSGHFGRSLFGYAVIAVVTAGLAIFTSVLFVKFKIRSPSQYVWLALIAAVEILITVRLWRAPEEAIHFLEYGLLGYFLFRALNISIKDKSLYLAAFLAGSMVGIFDEILQWITPGRYWDIRDVGLNSLAVGLFQIALWKGVRPNVFLERVRTKSVRLASVLLAANLILVGLCLSNTPKRIEKVTGIFPFLSFLKSEETMHEYRHKHEDPEIGTFYSRLSLAELGRIDAKRAEEYGRILTAWKDKPYEDFLRTYASSTHPFLYELRVHAYRRDRKFNEAIREQTIWSKKDLLFIAWKENQILEKHFGKTLALSAYRWPERKNRRVLLSIDPSQPYRSPVSAGIFATLKGKTLWTVILSSLALLFLLNLSWKRHSITNPQIRVGPGQ